MRASRGGSVTSLFAIQRLRQFGRADKGQALVPAALAPVALMLMAGLGAAVGVLRYEKQHPVAAQNLDDVPLNGTVLLSYQSTSEKHEANLRNPVAARNGLFGFLGESRRAVSLGR